MVQETIKTTRQPPPLGSRTWSSEELSYLEEHWGIVSIVSIAKKLNRTENAIIVKAQRLGLGPALQSGDYITFNQLVQTLLGHQSDSYQLQAGLKIEGFLYI